MSIRRFSECVCVFVSLCAYMCTVSHLMRVDPRADEVPPQANVEGHVRRVDVGAPLGVVLPRSRQVERPERPEAPLAWARALRRERRCGDRLLEEGVRQLRDDARFYFVEGLLKSATKHSKGNGAFWKLSTYTRLILMSHVKNILKIEDKLRVRTVTAYGGNHTA